MVHQKTYFLLIFLIAYAKYSLAQTHYTSCGQTTTFSAAKQVTNIKWPETNNKKTCVYIFKAPIDHYINATFTYTLSGTEPSCSSGQYIGVSLDNMANWEGYTRLCGTRSAANSVTLKSIGNELKIVIDSTTLTGSVNIKIEPLLLTQGKCDCSWTPKTRIISGVNAGKNEFVGNVAFKNEKPGSFFNETFCGGTLVTQKHIVTAGHCIVYMHNVTSVANVVIYVGRYNITAPMAIDSPYAEAHKIASMVHHHLYNSKTGSHDIGIVTTHGHVRFTRGVGPACLPFLYQGHNLQDKTLLTAIGFGATEYAVNAEYDTNSWILQKVSLYVNSTLAKDCKNNGTICASGVVTNYNRGDTCQRDSGGGEYGWITNRYFAFGVTSRGIDCGALNSFTYGTYIVTYLDWIKKQVGTHFLCDIRF